MDKKTKSIAFTGYTAKGIVYALTGILALFEAFNMGGEKAGKLAVIDYLENQIFGSVLVILLGIGLLSYAIWRFIQSINDPEDIGSDLKGSVKRISFFISGIIYAALGIISVLDALDISSLFQKGSGSENSILTGTTGTYVFVVIGVGLAIKGIYQFVKAYKGNFLEKFNIQSISAIAKRRYIKRIGYAGLISRGIVICIIAYFFLTAGFNLHGTTSQNMKGTAEAFSFIQQQAYGKWLLGIVAIGMVCYGLFMFSTAAYRKYDD